MGQGASPILLIKFQHDCDLIVLPTRNVTLRVKYLCYILRYKFEEIYLNPYREAEETLLYLRLRASYKLVFFLNIHTFY